MKLLRITSPLLIFFAFSVANTAFALTISPVKIEVTGDPGQTVRGEMELYNDQAETKTFFSSFENFEPSGDTGTPHFIGGASGLATWLGTNTEIEVPSSGKASIPYSITIPKDAEPGGYFAAIFWGTSDPRTQEAGEVSIGGKLGVLILLRVSGDIEEKAGISEWQADGKKRVFTDLPIDFSYRFANSGGDRVVPLGDIVITNSFGKNAVTLKANTNEGSVLPSSSRKFTAVWDSATVHANKNFFAVAKEQMQNFHFGVYTAHLHIVWGASNTPETEAFRFLIIPWQLLLLCSALLVVLFLGLKQYNKWIIAKSVSK